MNVGEECSERNPQCEAAIDLYCMISDSDEPVIMTDEVAK